MEKRYNRREILLVASIMKVFISWSGTRSHEVAKLLSDWVKCVLQATTPWISSRDIDRGALWFSEIGYQLQETTIGIICITKENKDKPWILFEAGALAKGLDTSRICTLLIDLVPSDLVDPLAQFNHTMPNKDDIRKLIATLNRSLGDIRLEKNILDQVFETYWPQFEHNFKKVIEDTPDTEIHPVRSEDSLLREILEHTRGLSKRVRSLEKQFPSVPSLDKSSPQSTRINYREFLELKSMRENIKVVDEGDGILNITIHHTDPLSERLHDVLIQWLKEEYGNKFSLTLKQDVRPVVA